MQGNILGGGGFKGKIRKAIKVKNKAPAPTQITAEQLLREAWERQEAEPKPPKWQILDEEELQEYRLRKRRDFEDAIRRNRHAIGVWIKYAAWEEGQKELERARSIFERALDVDHKNISIWLRYVEMEMRNKQIAHARNLWDRAVTLLPRVSQFWLKAIHMEDMLGNYARVRDLYERWMQWDPDENAWMAYIKWETRNGELERVRDIYRRFVASQQTVKAYLKWAKFEEKQGNIQGVRDVFDKAFKELGDDANDETLFIAFAKFEERCKEYDRARAIYKFALDHIPKQKAREVYKMFIQFEKQYGDREGIEDVILNRRRFQYEDEIKINPMNYDVWFDYIKLEEAHGDIAKIREVYERAIANVPPAQEKRYWKRYIYLWINYALFEELDAKDVNRARQVYKECLKIIPHKVFTFAKIWVLYANFEIRQKDVQAARQIFGNAIGMAPKAQIFKAYIELEMQLGEMDRCRKIYEKWLEWSPSDCHAWTKFAALEKTLDEIERARSIYELAIQQPLLDMPELLWKAYIDFEIELKEYNNVRKLYRRLLQRTKHVKVWISFAQFEASIGATSEARKIYREAFEILKSAEQKEERVMLYESWREFEEERGDDNSRAEVAKNQPKRVKKKRKIKTESGEDAGWEEYWDYIFPDEEAVNPNLKILEAARAWKLKQLQQQQQQQQQSVKK
jgi:crooked neck